MVKLDDAAKWDFEGIWKKLLARSSEPVIRQAVTMAMRILGKQFVLGRTIEEAMKESREAMAQGYRFSFDMLGEAAYTQKDADRYYASYSHALAAIAAAQPDQFTQAFERPSISVKLSALHPRYEWAKRERVFSELLPRLVELASQARRHNLGFTVDAEESERLDLMLDVFEAMGEAQPLWRWEGLGLALQAYSKRALPVIAWLGELGTPATTAHLTVRHVKGAYWDTEIKRAEEQGLKDYPVFTRKAATDTSYLACARALLAEESIYPQFATHNAHTLSAVQVFAGGRKDFEYQRLHGMGEALHELYRDVKKVGHTGPGTRIYAPVGTHEDLLAYLVRRLLENGANTSFVNRLADEEAPIAEIIADPVEHMMKLVPHRSTHIPKPEDLLPDRKNSHGFVWADPVATAPVLAQMDAFLKTPSHAAPLIGGETRRGDVQAMRDPSELTRVRSVKSSRRAPKTRRMRSRARMALTLRGTRWAVMRAHASLSARPIFSRRTARASWRLPCAEAGKTLPNALGEVREAVDFLRYYAERARALFGGPVALPGPTGETNELTLHGRGVFACISPWNFPLAIFTGQVAGALAAGNTVLAKPAEQTPLIAAAAVKLLHQAGVPVDALHLLPGDGPKIGNALFADPRLAGVAFTGSTEAANAINRALAGRDGPIATLIAETGGQNAMIVDSTALPEQVTRDVISSAFDSAGQRCSALRVLYLQDDVADKMLELILGAMDELKLGDPMKLETDIGPVIDDDARKMLEKHAERMTREAKLLRKLELGPEHRNGFFFPPHVFEIPSIASLKREVFGPVLHVVRYSSDRLDEVCDAINATGYGLTLGLHTRIEETMHFIRDRIHVGNVYVNRNQIGAVVGVQPFGGEGLSGTGPKAGGPNYLLRFALERAYTVNTTAAGGNAALLSSERD